MPQPLKDIPTLSVNGKVMGRHRKEPPEGAAESIQLAAARGGSMVGIAAKLGTSKDTLARWMKEHPDLQHAFEMGREEERQKLHDIVMRDAMDGEKPNVNAMFLLKCKHGYREGDQGEQGRTNITINMPGAMSREDFMKTVVAAHE